MQYPSRYLLLLLLSIPSATFGQSAGASDLQKCDVAPSLPFKEVEARTAQKGPVIVPALAKVAEIHGIVHVQICVSDSGEVVTNRLISGHPLLVTAGMESAKQWQFAPGHSSFKTSLEIDFSPRDGDADKASEQSVSRQYFAEEDKCRESVRAKDRAGALAPCKDGVQLAERLPPERVNERRVAYGLLGHAYAARQQFHEALGSYRTELGIASGSLKSDQAELGYAYHDVALACHALGLVSEAAENYSKAEETMVLAEADITTEDLKRRYAETLKQIRQHHLVLLQQTGQIEAAAALEKKMQEK